MEGELSQIKSANPSDAQDVLGSSTYSEFQTQGIDVDSFYQACCARFDYKINDVTVNGDNAQVKVTATNVDLNQAYTAWETEMTTWMTSDEAASLYASGGEEAVMKEAFAKLDAIINDPSTPTTTADVTIDLVKSDNTWTLADESQAEKLLFPNADLSTLGSTTNS